MLFLSTCFVGLSSCILIYMMHQFGLKKTSYIHYYLIIFVLLFAIHNFYLISTEETILIYSIFIAGGLFFLLGPCIFLYVRSILQNQTPSLKKDWIHFVIFGMHLIVFFPLLIQDNLITADPPKQLINQCLAVIETRAAHSMINPQILLIIIPVHVLGYLLYCLYQVIEEDCIDQVQKNNNTTMRILVYLFLLFHAYLAIMYGIACFIIYYERHFSATKTNHFPPENFTGSEHGIAALVALVLITTIMVLSTNRFERPSYLCQEPSK